MAQPSSLSIIVLDPDTSFWQPLLNGLRDTGQSLQWHAVANFDDATRQVRMREPHLVVVRLAAQLGDISELRQRLEQAASDAALIVALESMDEVAMMSALIESGADHVVFLSEPHLTVRLIQRQGRQVEQLREATEAQQHNEETENRLRTLMDSCQDAIAFIHEGVHLHANPAYLKLFGYSDESELSDVPLLELFCAADQVPLKDMMRAATRGGSMPPADLKARDQVGREFDVTLGIILTRVNEEPCLQIQIYRKTAALDSAQGGDADGAALTAINNQLMAAQGQLRALEGERNGLRQQCQQLDDDNQRLKTQLAELDGQLEQGGGSGTDFTGLLNRQRFTQLLSEQLKREEPPIGAMIYILLTDYRLVSENLGIEAADLLLRELGAKLAGMMPNGALVAHFADPVFTVFLEGLDEVQTRDLAQAISSDIEEHVSRYRHKMVASASAIGICMVEADDAEDDAFALISQSDRACEKARRRGPNQIALFVDQAEAATGESRDVVERRIQQALEKERFSVGFQPIASFAGDIRPRFKMYLDLLGEDGQREDPSELYRDATRYGLMIGLDHFTIERALATLSRHPEPEATLFVRLSGNVFREEENFAEWLQKTMAASDVSPNRLALEVPEELAEQHFDLSQRLREQLSKVGILFVLSHFGGKSNSERILRALKPDFVKLDITLIEKYVRSRDENTKRAMDAISDLTRDLDLQIIAADISSATQMASIYQFGITLVQGDMIDTRSNEASFNFAEFAG